MDKTYKLDKKMFGDMKSLVDRYNPPETSNAKFNIKVRAADWRVMEELAELTGRSRAFLMNDLVENILEGMLEGLYNDDKPSAAVLAAYVDMKCGKSGDLDGWVAQLPGAIAFDSELYMHEQGDSNKSDEILRRIAEATGK